MSATTTPQTATAENPQISLRVTKDSYWIDIIGGLFLCLGATNSVRHLIRYPEVLESRSPTIWIIFGALLLGWFVLLTVLRYVVLRIPASRITLVEDGLEVRTMRGSKVYSWSSVRSIRQLTWAGEYYLWFTNFHFIPSIPVETSEVFMTELSTRSGVAIKQTRLV